MLINVYMYACMCIHINTHIQAIIEEEVMNLNLQIGEIWEESEDGDGG